MSWGDIVAGYAAVVGTGSLGWQVYSTRTARRLDVEVRLANAMIGYREGATWTVSVTVINNGPEPIEVRSAGLYAQDGSGRTAVPVRIAPGDTIPGTCAPRHSLVAYLSSDWLEGEGFDLTRPLRGFAHLATGTVDSESKTLRKP